MMPPAANLLPFCNSNPLGTESFKKVSLSGRLSNTASLATFHLCEKHGELVGPWVPIPGCFLGFLGPNPWLFFFTGLGSLTVFLLCDNVEVPVEIKRHHSIVTNFPMHGLDTACAGKKKVSSPTSTMPCSTRAASTSPTSHADIRLCVQAESNDHIDVGKHTS